MNKRIRKIFKIILLVLILPLFAIAFAPPQKINAQCPATGTQISVNGGLLSAVNTFNFNAGSGVLCVTGTPAIIPQFSIQDYEAMKKDYFDQAKSTYNKITLPGNQVQSSPSSPINLLSL